MNFKSGEAGRSSIKMIIPAINKSARFSIKYLLSLAVFALLFPSILSAQGNLLITPRRIVFEGNKRSQDLNLANIGKDSATFSISIVQLRMKEDGSFEAITVPDPGQSFADRNLRFFPRTVTLPPNEAQVVKVQLLRTNQLTPGEYRSHFYFRAVPKPKPLGSENAVRDTTSISVQITPIFGITIPAIIRIGVSTTKVTLSDLVFETTPDGVPVLGLKFNRSGNFSVYGDISVDHVSPLGTITHVGDANGVAVYTPNATRSIKFRLNAVNGVDYRSGKLLIRYSAPSDVKPEKYAEAELALK